MSTPLVLDNRPWYRQLWPWLVMIPPAAAVVGGFITLTLAIRHADPLVTESHLKRGLAVVADEHGTQAAARLGVQGQLELDRSTGRLRLTLSGRSQPALLSLTFSHPTLASRDVTLPLLRDAHGVYTAATQLDLHGRWYLKLNPPDQSWELNALLPADADRLRLIPTPHASPTS